MGDAEKKQEGQPAAVDRHKAVHAALVLEVLQTKTDAKQYGEDGVEFAIYYPQVEGAEHPIQVRIAQSIYLLQGNVFVTTPTLDIGKQNTQYRQAANGIDNMDSLIGTHSRPTVSVNWALL